MAQTESRKRAIKKQMQKRVGQPRMPGAYISDNENALLIEMGELYGSKKAAIFAGLLLLKKFHSDKNKKR
ncbi:hypothetical protein A9G34_01105 [Gilliamella sp. Choc4-2]|uniref:hypothetical protein n=1 Tax=unclassified Gilliamella TaxID=2685620 RepID=UPI00080EAC7A|nr:hypothetical protein [Gilliamella apicola]OCG45729.1 hypothetical protein A9G34_01105 [Gilliamella apicola]OCG65006.1 hypothetical protein A9G48_01145 [Gilliamella apicola]